MRTTILFSILVACSGKDGGTTDTGGGGGGLTEEEFGEQFLDIFCEEWEACNTSEPCPVGATTTRTTTATTECDYDPVAAQDCLDGSWTCNTDFPGFEYPVAPSVCSEVCGGAPTTPTG